MDDLVLIKPNKNLYLEYKDMMDEWIMEGSRISPWPLSLKYHTEELFNEMLKRIIEVEKGINIAGYVPSTTYWLYDKTHNTIIGCSNLRHYLDELGEKYWGHIGYGIRPSERRKGYGTKILELTLEKAKEMNINKVSLGAYVGNIPSWKTMEKCHAKFDKIIYEEDTGLPIKKYWINT